GRTGGAWRTWSPSLLSCRVDECDQPRQLLGRQVGRRVAEVRGDGLFEGALEERVEHAAQGRPAGPVARLGGRVDVLEPFLAVREVALLFEDGQEGADGGPARRVGQGGPHLRGRGLAPGVDDVEDLPLAAAEVLFRPCGHGWSPFAPAGALPT